MIARTNDRFLLYASMLNVTALREAQQRERETAERMRAVLNDRQGDAAAERLQKELLGTLPCILEAVVDSSTEIWFAKDKDLRYICCSRMMATQAGLKDPRDVVGKTDFELYDRVQAQRFCDSDRLLLESGKPLIDMVETLLFDDGMQHCIRTSKYLLRDAAGNAVGVFGVGRDETAPQIAYEQLQLLTNSIPGGLATYELFPGGMRLLYCSDGYFRHTGYTKEEYAKLAADGPVCLVLEEDLPTIAATVKRVLAGEDSFRYEYRARTKDGGFCWLDVQGVVIERHVDGAVVNVVKQDVTERKAADEKLRISEEQFRIAAAVSGMAVARYNIKTGVYTHDNKILLQRGFGAEVPNVPQTFLDTDMVGAETVPEYRELYQKMKDGARRCSATVALRGEDGAFRWMHMEATVIADAEGKPSEAIIVHRDVTSQREQEWALRKRAETDGMTGVYNRGVMEGKIRDHLAAESGRPCAFLIADIDNLKTINDTLGHPQGDRAIRLLAETMETQFRKTDIVGRVGGDEFAAFLPNLGDGERLRSMMRVLIEKVSGFRIGEGDNVPVCVSVGVATAEAGDASFEQLYEHADKALYAAKGGGKKQVVFYTPQMDK